MTANKTSPIKLLVHLLLSCYYCDPHDPVQRKSSYIYAPNTPPHVCVYISNAMLAFQPVLYWEGNVLRPYSRQGSEVRVLQDGRQLRASKNLQPHQFPLNYTHVYLYPPCWQSTGSQQQQRQPRLVWSHSGVSEADKNITSCSCLLSTGAEDISLCPCWTHLRRGHEDMRTFLYCDKEISNAIRILYICIIRFRYVVSHVQR